MPATMTYQSPGVYIVEEDKGTKPIEGVGVSMPAFFGITRKASTTVRGPLVIEGNVMTFGGEEEVSLLGKPQLVANWTQFVEKFGSFAAAAYLPDAVYGHFNNGGGPCYVVSVRTLAESGSSAASEAAPAQAAAVKIPAAPRGTSFKITARTPGVAGNSLKVTIASAEDGTFSLTVGTETKNGLTMKSGDANSIGTVQFADIEIAEISSNTPKAGEYALAGGVDAVAATASAPMLAPITATDLIGDPEQRTGFGGLEAIDDIRLLVCPDVMVGYDGSEAQKERVKMVQQAMIDYCERVRYSFAILDTPPDLSVQQVLDWRQYVNFDTSHAALYYPWVKIADLSSVESRSKFVPPSGHLAGLYGRVDSDRGVHKAPANETIRGVIDLQNRVSRGEQNLLNPKGINCIRTFPNRGIRVWGARTLSSNGAWRYISVRRLFIFVEASLEAGLQWVVFEPNDSTLWAKVRRDITSFLRNVWRTGALFGATPSLAFYVKCDEELNPFDVRDLGQLIIEVGLAPVKPAEFVIVRISQWAGADAEAA